MQDLAGHPLGDWIQPSNAEPLKGFKQGMAWLGVHFRKKTLTSWRKQAGAGKNERQSEHWKLLQKSEQELTGIKMHKD